MLQDFGVLERGNKNMKCISCDYENKQDVKECLFCGELLTIPTQKLNGYKVNSVEHALNYVWKYRVSQESPIKYIGHSFYLGGANDEYVVMNFNPKISAGKVYMENDRLKRWVIDSVFHSDEEMVLIYFKLK